MAASTKGARQPERKPVKSTAERCDSLERRVQTYYEALGYRVTRNVAIDHHQLDMVATKHVPGGPVMTLMIECKSRGDSVGVNEVTAFRNTATHLIHTQRITYAVLVTNASFTKEANGVAADSATVRLLTLEQLEQEVFNSTESLVRTIHDYETRAIHHEFVPLHGLDANERSVDILKFITKWASPRESPLLIVGDFGCGKTTLIERAHYEFARIRVDNAEALFPVLLRLRSFRRYADLWSFVEASLRDNQYITAARRVFETELRAGRLILFMDGLDEINTGASAKDRGLYLSQLAPLLKSASPCVISTRPTYFESFDAMLLTFEEALAPAPAFQRVRTLGLDLDRLLSQLELHDDLRLPREALAHTLRVKSLDTTQILARLKKNESALTQATGMSLVQFRDFLLRIYDIQDLMKRPLLLKMIIETALSADVDFFSDNAKHGPAALYELYTQMCASRDVTRAPDSQYLIRDARLEASRRIALAMFRADRLQLPTSEVTTALRGTKFKAVNPRKTRFDAEHFNRALTDIRLCSFLKFDADGTLAFTHKSYLEFFVAQHGYLQAQKGAKHLVRYADENLKSEHLYFLGSFARDQPGFGDMLKTQLQHAQGSYRTFLLRAIFASGTLLNGMRLENGFVHSVEVRRTELEGTFLHHLRLDGVSIGQITASRWSVEHVELLTSSIRDCAFFDSRISVGGGDYLIAQVSSQRSHWRFGGTKVAVDGFQARGSVITLDGTGVIHQMKLDDTSTLIIGTTCTILGRSHIVVDAATVIGLAQHSWYGEETRIIMKGCRLSGVLTSLNDLQQGRISLTDCSGTIILHNELGQPLDASTRTRLRQSYPSIEFIDAQQLHIELNHLDSQRRRSTVGKKNKRAARPPKISVAPFEPKELSRLLRGIQDQATASHFERSYLRSYLASPGAHPQASPRQSPAKGLKVPRDQTPAE